MRRPKGTQAIVQDFENLGKSKAPALAAAQGTRASANTSGPDFTWAVDAGEIADPKIRTERRKLVSSAGPILGKSELLQTAIRPLT
jgi:hypothetical protein